MVIDDEYEGAESQDVDEDSDTGTDVPETKVLLVSETELEGILGVCPIHYGLNRGGVARCQIAVSGDTRHSCVQSFAISYSRRCFNSSFRMTLLTS
jgi:hypothetical protein